MQGLFINQNSSDLSAQEIFERFLMEKECMNSSPETLKYYRDCFTAFRQVL